MRLDQVLLAIVNTQLAAKTIEEDRQQYRWLVEVLDRTGPVAFYLPAHGPWSPGYWICRLRAVRYTGVEPWEHIELVGCRQDALHPDREGAPPMAHMFDLPTDLELLAPDWLLEACRG